MGLPSKRRTTRSKKERASHFALKETATTKCKDCGATTLPHKACAKCGTYRGRKAVNVAKRVARKQRAAKAKK